MVGDGRRKRIKLQESCRNGNIKYRESDGAGPLVRGEEERIQHKKHEEPRWMILATSTLFSLAFYSRMVNPDEDTELYAIPPPITSMLTLLPVMTPFVDMASFPQSPHHAPHPQTFRTSATQMLSVQSLPQQTQTNL